MELDVLKAFCAEEGIGRTNLEKPFTLPGKPFVYAADGKLMVRVPMRDGWEIEVSGLRYENEFAALDSINTDLMTPFADTFTSAVSTGNCFACHGKGVIPATKNCPSCDGEGQIYCKLRTCSGHDCCQCGGDGFNKNGGPCQDCEGNGMHVALYSQQLNFYLSKQLAVRIATLPKLIVGCVDKDMLCFAFDGGVGIAMRYRVEDLACTPVDMPAEFGKAVPHA